MGFVTIRDVAQKAGVSIATVSQILHGKGRFSKKTKKLVMNTVDALGYIPDSRAQAIRMSDSKMVGLLVPDLRNRYFADLVSSMENILYEEGFNTLIGTSAESVERQDSFITNILGQRFDGLIIIPQGVESAGLKALVKRNIPTVFVDRRVPGMDTIPYVVSDPRPGLVEAMRALYADGHRKIAYLAHPSLKSFSLNERAEAFKKLSPQFFGKSGSLILSSDGKNGSLEMELNRIEEFGATALIFGYSPDAISCLGIFHDRGIKIGSCMSLISFDDIDVFNLMTPRISIISQQAEKMGRRGVEMLLELIRNGVSGMGAMVSIPTIFIHRESVGPAPASASHD